MTTSMALLRVRGDRALTVSIQQGNSRQDVPAVFPRAAAEFGRLLELRDIAHIAWLDERIEPYVQSPAAWSGLLTQPLEVLHLSCFQRCDRMVGSLGLVDFSSCFLLPGPTDRRFVTWLLSPMAGMGRADLFRACGFAGTFRSFGLALFDAGYRGIQWGMCPYSEPALWSAPAPAECLAPLQVPLAPGETAVLIRRMLGRKWVLFWLLGRLLFDRRLSLVAAARGLLARGAPGVDADAIQRLHPPSSTDDGMKPHSAPTA